MKRILLVLLVLVLLPLGTVWANGKAESDDGVIKLGLNAALTGAAAWSGFHIRDAAEFAVEQINAAGGINGRQVELLVRDNASEPTKAASTFLELQNEGVAMMLGPIHSVLLPTLSELANRYEFPTIFMPPGDLDMLDKAEWEFYSLGRMDQGTDMQVQYMKDAGCKSAVTFSAVDDVWVDSMNEFVEKAEAAGIDVYVFPEPHASDEVDFVPMMTKIKEMIKQNNIQWICPQTYNGGAFAKAYEALGFDSEVNPVFCHSGMVDPTLLDIGGKAVEGWYGVMFKTLNPYSLEGSGNSHDQYTLKVVREFEAAGLEMDPWKMTSYDACQIAFEALKLAGDDFSNTSIRKALESVDLTTLISPELKFDSAIHYPVDTKNTFMVFEIDGGEFTKVDYVF